MESKKIIIVELCEDNKMRLIVDNASIGQIATIINELTDFYKQKYEEFKKEEIEKQKEKLKNESN